MIFRSILYFLLLLVLCEGVAISAVAWSFYESSRLSLNLLKITSDNKARDILFSLAKAAEVRMTPEGLLELSTDFGRIKKQAEKDLDKFGVKEIFILSDSGKVIAHSDKEEISIPLKSRPILEKYNKPFFMRALRMRKGQFPIPQDYGEQYNGDGTKFGEILLKLFPEIKIQTVTVSSPVYHLKKLETVASIHLIYDRGNFHFFLDKQRELFYWMLVNYSIIAFGACFFLNLVYMIFSFFNKKQGILETTKKVYPINSSPPVLKKIQIPIPKEPKIENKPEIKKMELKPSTITQLNESKIEKLPEPIVQPKASSPVVLDAIYLD
ncbi:MAG: hypothetical protein L6Q54_10570 [Leptospiraceae bacterium]|nr:hypothetical protein [Leptospiraceae bacterium]MCK6381671.1 hypothetical protein [Leptospiraceae bacterium]NUM40435.1 hypothetical protein [Leptospiraceae bacterium]